jgi:hypothetical protein
MILKKKSKEQKIDDFRFNVFKFTKRQKSSKVLIITNFCELGVETLACMYSIPRLLEIFNSYYVILVGWSGRDYFYRHLVDEFWELKSENYWLKDSCNAFYHNSENLDRLENELKKIGILFKGHYLGNFLVSNVCKKCFNSWKGESLICGKCGAREITHPLFDRVENKKFLRSIPKPKKEVVDSIREYVPDNSVAVFARNRKTYGRNLPKSFYYDLNNLIKDKGYTPIYLGENSSSLNMEGCVDFSAMPMVQDLSFTLSVLSCVKFSIQFWTASTRLSSIVNTPFVLVESVDQIALRGQEGLRIASASDFNKKKIILCNYLSFLENLKSGLDAVETAIDEVELDNWDYVTDLVGDKKMVYSLLDQKGLLSW